MRIEDYAIIGDTESVALVVSTARSTGFACPGSTRCFAALLGDARNGRWRLGPKGPVTRATRRYRPGTLVLETELHTADGVVRIVDCMPIRSEHPHVVRLVERISGSVPMELELVIRFDYGRVLPWVRRVDGRLCAVAGPDALVLATPVPTRGKDLATVGDFAVREGDRVPFVLSYHRSHEPPPASPDAADAIERTETWWSEWSARCTERGPHREAVVRSLVTLKASTYAPTGGIVAAATTSLPETIGGGRNWDYRYRWLRDATFTLCALLDAGYRDEAAYWRDWLLRAVAGSASELQIMYKLAGERYLQERTLDWLAGYEASRPVRIGNAAAGQLQLDVYGEVLDSLHQARRVGLAPDPALWDLESSLCTWLESNWSRPDEGLWEIRGPRRHFTHSKVMAWVAMDRAIKACELTNRTGPLERWRKSPAMSTTSGRWRTSSATARRAMLVLPSHMPTWTSAMTPTRLPSQVGGRFGTMASTGGPDVSRKNRSTTTPYASRVTMAATKPSATRFSHRSARDVVALIDGSFGVRTPPGGPVLGRTQMRGLISGHLSRTARSSMCPATRGGSECGHRVSGEGRVRSTGARRRSGRWQSARAGVARGQSVMGPSASIQRTDAQAFQVGANVVRLLRDGAVDHAAMLRAIAEAREEILLEMYWIGADHVGKRFRDALADRAANGIAVKVIYDAIGSYGAPRDFWAPLLAAGGEVREFSPIAPWHRRFKLSRLRYRDHRKNLCVDGEVGFCGGINLGDQWAPEVGPGWRDDAIEIRGPAALRVRQAFFRVWADLGGDPVVTAAPAAGGSLVRVLTNEIVGGPDRAIRIAYLDGIRGARTSILLASAYFLPGPVFLLALREAARRGVVVKVLVPGRSDVWLVTMAAGSIIGRLLADGIEVFAYEGRILHSKTAVFDERTAMIGSHNLDVMSWRFNLECNVAVDDPAFAAHAARSFERDCDDAVRLTLAEWRSRPWPLRFFAWVLALFRVFL